MRKEERQRWKPRAVSLHLEASYLLTSSPALSHQPCHILLVSLPAKISMNLASVIKGRSTPPVRPTGLFTTPPLPAFQVSVLTTFYNIPNILTTPNACTLEWSSVEACSVAGRRLHWTHTPAHACSGVCTPLCRSPPFTCMGFPTKPLVTLPFHPQRDQEICFADP